MSVTVTNVVSFAVCAGVCAVVSSNLCARVNADLSVGVKGGEVFS